MLKRKTVSNDNDNDPSSWTSSKLKTELQNLGINISVTLSRKNLVNLYKDNVPKDNSNRLQARTPHNSVQDIHENSNIDSVSADFISYQSDLIVENLINTSNIQEAAVGNGQRTSAHVSLPTPVCTEHVSASQG